MYRHTLYLHDALPILGPEQSRRYRGETIVTVIGLRRDESTSRRSTPISRSDERFAKQGNAAVTNMLSRHPPVDWSAQDVLGIHERHGLPLPEAYVSHPPTRLHCAFRVLGYHTKRSASRQDHANEIDPPIR